MATNNNHTVQPITGGASTDEIITTLNHNFQVLTERIKDLNLDLSYLDVLKIAQIFKAVTVPSKNDGESDADYKTRIKPYQDDNKTTFTSTCWNTLANYAGVYIQSDSPEILFVWMGENIHRGDFIIKLPNNQSLHLAGEPPKYFVPTSYNTTNNQLVFTQATTASSATSTEISIFSTIAGSNMLETGSTQYDATEETEDYKDCRFYVDNGEEIFFSGYVPGTTFTIPAGAPTVTAHYIKQKPGN